MKTCFLLLVGVSMLLGRSAAASCISGTSCLCRRSGPLVDGRVAQINGPKTTVEAQAIYDAVGDAGTTFNVARESEDFVGRAVLLFLSQGDVASRIGADDAGVYVCPYSSPPLRLTADAAVAAATSADCAAFLRDAGFREPPCRDTGGCSATDGLGAAAVATLVALGARLRGRSRLR